MVETALVFPVMLMCVFGFFQLTLLAHAHGVVRYAAFQTARAASVWIPQDLVSDQPGFTETGGDPLQGDHHLYCAAGYRKWDEINQAARLSLVPISPPAAAVGVEDSGASAEAEVALGALPDFPAQEYADRYGYAAAATEVLLDGAECSGSTSFGDFHSIEVTVAHEYYLPVPWVNGMFAGFERSGVGGQELYTAHIEATVVLPLETAFDIDEDV